MEAFAGISGNGNFNIVVGQIPVCFIDLDPNHSSGPKMQEAIQTLDIANEYVTEIPDDLSLYSSLFVCLGIYSDNYTLDEAEGQLLADWLEQGGRLYMEGGDTWAYDTQTAVHELFNINGTNDGSGNLGTIIGMGTTLTEDMSFNYSGENSYIDQLATLGDAFIIFHNDNPSYVNAIANDAGIYKTIGASFEFGGLDDNAPPSTKEELMKGYLNFFGLLPPPIIANFTSDVNTICTTDSVHFMDLSQGDVLTWEWAFPGANPTSSTEQNPVVAYDSSGVYDVTLLISNGEIFQEISRSAYITVNEIPEASISGTTTLCYGDSALITINLAGTAPWILSMNTQDTIEINDTIYSYWTYPEMTSQYWIMSVSDANGCSSEGQDTAIVTVNELPTAIISGDFAICPGDSAQAVVELTGTPPWSLEIIDETDNWIFEEIEGTTFTHWFHPEKDFACAVNSVSDGNLCLNTGEGTMSVVIKPLPEIPVKPEGVDSVDVYKVTNSEFAITDAPNALSYIWSIDPEEAGTITGSETTGLVEWNIEFEGDALVTAKAVNDCDTSDVSVQKSVTIFNSVGFEDLNNLIGVDIIPNPNDGSFNLIINSIKPDMVNIRLMNSLGSILLEKENIKIEQVWSQQFDMYHLNEGIYYLSIDGINGTVVKKILIQK